MAVGGTAGVAALGAAEVGVGEVRAPAAGAEEGSRWFSYNGNKWWGEHGMLWHALAEEQILQEYLCLDKAVFPSTPVGRESTTWQQGLERALDPKLWLDLDMVDWMLGKACAFSGRSDVYHVSTNVMPSICNPAYRKDDGHSAACGRGQEAVQRALQDDCCKYGLMVLSNGVAGSLDGHSHFMMGLLDIAASRLEVWDSNPPGGLKKGAEEAAPDVLALCKWFERNVTQRDVASTLVQTATQEDGSSCGRHTVSFAMRFLAGSLRAGGGPSDEVAYAQSMRVLKHAVVACHEDSGWPLFGWQGLAEAAAAAEKTAKGAYCSRVVLWLMFMRLWTSWPSLEHSGMKVCASVGQPLLPWHWWQSGFMPVLPWRVCCTSGNQHLG